MFDDNMFSLFVDIDDVLVSSSPLIQKQVNEKTIFKTSVLRNIEQLKRNCEYFVKEIEKECNVAFDEKRLPDFKRFPKELFEVDVNNFNFDLCSQEELNKIYLYPIGNAMYYLKVADLILNQFLEERDMFLENDNLPYGVSKNYNYPEEEKNIEMFKQMIVNNYKALTLVNEFCVNEVKNISINARNNGVVPDYGALVKMDSNDIIRTNDSNNDYEYYVYEKPIIDVQNCINGDVLGYALNNFDILKTPSKELINYDSIYQIENVNLKAVLMIKKVLLSESIKSMYIISHHNGDREFNAKNKLMQELFPGVEVIGLRFHDSEHNIKRRYRSSKFAAARRVCNLDAKYMILLDDSKDNCKDWVSNDGKVILYRKVTDAERTSKIENSEYPRITDFDYLEATIEDIVTTQKQKRKYIF